MPLLFFFQKKCLWQLPFKNVPVARFRQKKTATFIAACVLALPIFPGSRPPSIVGANELNFCVRDGNRWTLIAINTNSYGWSLLHLLS